MQSTGIGIFESCPQLQTVGPLDGGYNIEFGWTTKVPDFVFAAANFYNMHIEHVTLPSSIAELGIHAFYYCGGLLDINLPTNLAIIGEGCFTYCYQLQNIDVPSNVTYLGDNAFDHCLALRNARLWLPNSSNRITSPEKAWFTGTSKNVLTVHILSTLDTLAAQRAYGDYWAVHSEAAVGYNYVQVENDL
jgi:hypothetical protein